MVSIYVCYQTNTPTGLLYRKQYMEVYCTVKSNYDLVKSQIGDVRLPSGVKACECPIHGTYLAVDKKDSDCPCPYCSVYMDTNTNDKGNGTTASQLEQAIDVRDAIRNTLYII